MWLRHGSRARSSPPHPVVLFRFEIVAVTVYLVPTHDTSIALNLSSGMTLIDLIVKVTYYSKLSTLYISHDYYFERNLSYVICAYSYIPTYI